MACWTKGLPVLGALLLIGTSTCAQTFRQGHEALVRRDYRVAFTIYKKLAAGGNSQAHLGLSHLYDEGLGVPRNRAEARRWTRSSADLGMPVAQFEVGTWYANGAGVHKDRREALRWYLKAAEGGYDHAQMTIAGMYADGDVLSKDPDKACFWQTNAVRFALGDSVKTMELLAAAHCDQLAADRRAQVQARAAAWRANMGWLQSDGKTLVVDMRPGPRVVETAAAMRGAAPP
jgi:TPR repeat protein